MSNSIVPNFIIKRVSEKIGFLIMFRDGTGNCYVLPEITAALHNDPVNELPKLKLKPSYKATIDKDGRFQVQLLSEKVTAKNTVLSRDITTMINKEELTFLNKGFLSPDVLIGIALSDIDDQDIERDSSLPSLTETEKLKLATRSLTESMIRASEERAKVRGTSYNSDIARANLLSRFSSPKVIEAKATEVLTEVSSK